MDLAVCLWEFNATAENIDRLRAQGVEAVELGAPVLKYTTTEQTEAIAQRLRVAGVRVYACHAPFGGDDDLSGLDETVREKAVAMHRLAMDRAARLGAKCLVIHPSGPLGETCAQDRGAAFRQSLETLLLEAERLRMLLAVENMLSGHLGARSDELLRIIEGLGPGVGVCFDTGHARLTGEGVREALQVLRSYVRTFHLQDTDGIADKHLQPPYGVIDWAAVGGELATMDISYPVSVEASPWNQASYRVMFREVRAALSGQLLRLEIGATSVRVQCERCGHYLMGMADAWSCACRG